MKSPQDILSDRLLRMRDLLKEQAMCKQWDKCLRLEGAINELEILWEKFLSDGYDFRDDAIRNYWK